MSAGSSMGIQIPISLDSLFHINFQILHYDPFKKNVTISYNLTPFIAYAMVVIADFIDNVIVHDFQI